MRRMNQATIACLALLCWLSTGWVDAASAETWLDVPPSTAPTLSPSQREEANLPDSRLTYTRKERQRIRYYTYPLVSQAEAHAKRGDFAQAEQALVRVAEYDAGNNVARLALVNTYEKLGKVDRALAVLDELLAYYPDAHALRLNAANLATRSGQVERALAYYRDLLGRVFDAGAALDFHYLLLGRINELRPLGAPEEELRSLYRQSLPHLLRATEDRATPKETRLKARYELAQVYRVCGETKAYADLMQQVVQATPDGHYAYEYAGFLRGRGDYEPALVLYERAFDTLRDKKLRYQTCLAMADILLVRQEPEKAAQWLERARPFGKLDRDWHQAKVRAGLQTGNYGGVVEQLLRLPGNQDWVNLQLGFAFSGQTPPMPGLALAFMNQVHQPEKLSREEQFNLFSNRAFLHYDQARDEDAIADLDRALAVGPADDLELVRLRALNRMQAYQQTLDRGLVLAGKGDRNPRFLGEVYETMGFAAYGLQQPEDAVHHLTEALSRKPDLLQARFIRGLAYLQLNREEEAVEDLKALEPYLESFPPTLWGDLAFALGRLGDYDEGIRWMERSLGVYPYDLEGWQELGYQSMKHKKNAKAQDAFARAIELYDTILPFTTPDDEAEAYLNLRMSLKQEYTKLDKTWGFQLYGQRTDFDFADLPADAPVDSTRGALQSQGGLGLSYRPPVVGFRNERTLDLFGRVLANTEPDSWRADEDSYQGGLGLLYKPFIRHNYALSFERLFKIGDDAEDNWLWRNTYGLEGGERPPRDQELWLYRRFYGEASYYLQDLRRWVYFGQGQAGPSFLLSDNLILTLPEILVAGRYQDRDPDRTGTYWYAGPGLSLRLLEGERARTRDRWVLNAYAHYVWGSFKERPDTFDDETFNGWIIGLNLFH